MSPLRLTEKGYSVGVLEAGARFEDTDFPKTSFELRKYLFAPEVGCYGIQRIDALKDAMILSGAGVGGGSLVYANTLYEPMDAFYRDPQWRDITDWKDLLLPYYDQAKRMLGVVENPLRTPSDDVMEKVAGDMGVGDTSTRPRSTCSSAVRPTSRGSRLPTRTSVEPARTDRPVAPAVSA